MGIKNYKGLLCAAVCTTMMLIVVPGVADAQSEHFEGHRNPHVERSHSEHHNVNRQETLEHRGPSNIQVHNRAQRNYSHNGRHYNYFHQGIYYQYLINGVYYNYYYRGHYYKTCRKALGDSPVMVCH